MTAPEHTHQRHGTPPKPKRERFSNEADSINSPTGHSTIHPTVAYLCMEFAVKEGLEMYSGGLGILAGDVVKTAVDNQLPIFGVGILWNEGYVSQTVTETGEVVDHYTKADRSGLVEVADCPPFDVVVGDEVITLHVLEPKDFKGYLYLLEPIKEEHRQITRRLYQGTSDDRLKQEIVLGVGAVRMVRAMGKNVDFFHFNEGHAVFASLELIREKVSSGKSFDDAMAATNRQCVFTTHTPVIAGNETHSIDSLYKIGGKALNFTIEQLKQIGGSPFGMSEAGFYLTCRYNAVSELHSLTAEKMWSHLKLKRPIISITNGVHTTSWQDQSIRDQYGIEISEAGIAIPKAPLLLINDKIWEHHMKAKTELIAEMRKLSNGRIKIDADCLLIGFARRAASYKRHTLLFLKHTTVPNSLDVVTPRSKKVKDNEAVISQMLADSRLQIIFSGKAHPQDADGKRQIKILVEKQKDCPNGVYYVENYDIKIGRLLTRGCDVWLNTPIRPMEASGTSGMKAAMNGVLNCSILDGWWPEACEHGVNGWQIGNDTENVDSNDADQRDSALLREVLINEVIPCYYDDVEKTKWRTMMRCSIGTTFLKFSSDRMMRDYRDKLYCCVVE